MFGQIIVAVAILAQTGGTQAEWKPFTSAKGKFTVSFPMKPSEKKRALAASGKTFDLVSSTARKGLATYVVATADVSGAEPEAVLKAAQIELVGNLKGELKDEKPSSLGDFSGSELAVEIPKKVMPGGGSSTCRLYVVKGRLYELIATVPTAKADSLTEDVSQFFESFKPAGVELVADGSDVPKTEKPISTKPIMEAKEAKPAAPGGGSIMSGLASLRQIGGVKPKAPEVQKPGDDAVKALGPEWREFKSPDGKFTISLPGEPQEIPVQIPTPNGNIDAKFYLVQRGEGGVFMVAATPLPGVPANADANLILEGSKNGMVGQFSGSKILEEKKIVYGGAPGRDITLEIPKGAKAPIPMNLKCRILYVDGTIYQIQAIQPLEGAMLITPEEIAGCCASLKFPGKK